ncbi:PHOSPHATIDYLETHANOLAMINE N-METHYLTRANSFERASE [Salix viminalis]|uniref:phosphatidyl-N-methylethanolamine N-methyltransferase n=1 Tax=Salix viminalis TaxID=40686 RepID=A0A9Q0T706_SALVM|nr:PHOSPHATIDYLETHANOLAMINE N-METHYLTRANSFERASE [Salix viminalis]
MGIFAAVGVLLPFPYYYWLWTNPQAWVNLCGKDKDPSKVMAYVSHFLKLLQFISLFSVSTLAWPPPLYFWPLFGFGQFLNFSLIAIPLVLFMLNLMLIFGYLYRDTRYPEVYQLLGEAGTYYGVRFGKNVPWVTEFPFGVIRDPQYVGSVMSLFACLSWVPFHYILLWTLGYVFIIHMESKEDPATRAKPVS